MEACYPIISKSGEGEVRVCLHVEPSVSICIGPCVFSFVLFRSEQHFLHLLFIVRRLESSNEPVGKVFPCPILFLYPICIHVIPNLGLISEVHTDIEKFGGVVVPSVEPAALDIACAP